MSPLVKLFLLFCAIFTYSFFLLLGDASYSQTRAHKLQALTAITKTPSLDYSSGYMQQRNALYRDSSAILYPNMLIESKRDFVYAY
jgi:hypothetical protein